MVSLDADPSQVHGAWDWEAPCCDGDGDGLRSTEGGVLVGWAYRAGHTMTQLVAVTNVVVVTVLVMHGVGVQVAVGVTLLLGV
jgi:hypothetical protein